MAEVGTYYITIMPEMSHFTSGVNSALNGAGTQGGKTYSKTFMDVLKGSAIGTAIGSLATRAGSSIMSGLNTGIGRLDTIKNFPRVMESFGFSAEEASDKIKLIMKRLDGLPTATHDVVSLTQAIADSTGDLDLAARAALGFNDMMLASGASSAEMVQAQGVLNRVLGKGNATVAQWQSLQSVMPAQLAAVSRELLGESGTVEELRDKLNDGTISWDDFLQAVVKLDEEGSGAMASFEQQARANSDGIGTALQNVQNRIGAGWASILEEIGREDISGTIDRMSYGVRDAMQRIADAIGWVKEKIGDTSIAENFSKLAEAVGKVVDGLWTDQDTETVKKMAEALIDMVDGALQWLAEHGEAAGVALVAIGSGLVGIAGAKGIMKLPGIMSGITAALGGLSANPFVLFAAAVLAAVGALWAFFTQTEAGQKIWQGFCDIMSNLWTGLQEDFDSLIETVSQGFDTASEVWSTFTDNVAQWNEDVRQSVDEKWTAVKDAVSGYAQEAKDNVVSNWRESQQGVAQWNEQIRQNASRKWSEISRAIGDKLSSIKTSASTAWNNLKTGASTAWNAMKTTAVNTWNNIKNSLVEKWNAIKTSASEKWNAIKTTISGIVDRIKGLLSFSWSLPKPTIPHINLPHFSVTTKKVLGVDIPSVSVSWYAKGGIFDSPSLIGVGEAGREAVLPLNRQSYAEIARGIAGEGAGGVVVTGNTFFVREEADIDRIAAALSRKIRRERMAMA